VIADKKVVMNIFKPRKIPYRIVYGKIPVLLLSAAINSDSEYISIILKL
jgi:hypothetical protein